MTRCHDIYVVLEGWLEACRRIARQTFLRSSGTSHVMDASRRDRYHQKLAALDRYLDLLQGWTCGRDVDAIVEAKDIKDLFSIYHAFQLAAEVVADVASMLARDLTRNVSDDYSNFNVLVQKNVITEGSLARLKDLNGLRNRVVHDYNGPVDGIAVSGILEALDAYPAFKEAVAAWLARG